MVQISVTERRAGRERRVTMAKNTCEFAVGRLLEIEVAAGYQSVADVDDMIRMIGERLAAVPPNEKVVIAADWRAVQVMAPETGERARQMLAGVNSRVKRSAILTLADHSTTNLQVVRLVREAENRDRRHFTSLPAMHAWLSEVLSPDESARLKVFLRAP